MSNRVIKFRFFTHDGIMIEDHEGWTEGIGINEALNASAGYGYKIMQFTGLLDKNGKEIYESDIIEVENDGSDPICTVEWNTGQWLLMDNLGGSWTRQLYHQPHRLKILGNIYETTNQKEDLTL